MESMGVKLTKRGIAYNLKLSPYKKKINYGGNRCLTYVFSSTNYLKKFEGMLEDNRININNSLSKRFGFTIMNDLLCDIKLYSTIEKRGFLILNNKEGFECLESIKLDGKNLMQNV